MGLKDEKKQVVRDVEKKCMGYNSLEMSDFVSARTFLAYPQDQRTVLLARAGLDGGVNGRIIQKAHVQTTCARDPVGGGRAAGLKLELPLMDCRHLGKWQSILLASIWLEVESEKLLSMWLVVSCEMVRTVDMVMLPRGLGICCPPAKEQFASLELLEDLEDKWQQFWCAAGERYCNYSILFFCFLNELLKDGWSRGLDLSSHLVHWKVHLIRYIGLKFWLKVPSLRQRYCLCIEYSLLIVEQQFPCSWKMKPMQHLHVQPLKPMYSVFTSDHHGYKANPVNGFKVPSMDLVKMVNSCSLGWFSPTQTVCQFGSCWEVKASSNSDLKAAAGNPAALTKLESKLIPEKSFSLC